MILPKQKSFWHRTVLYRLSCTRPPIGSARWKESATNQPLAASAFLFHICRRCPSAAPTRPRLPRTPPPSSRHPLPPRDTASLRPRRARRNPGLDGVLQVLASPRRHPLSPLPLRRFSFRPAPSQGPYLAASSRRRPAPAAAAARGAAAGANGPRRRCREMGPIHPCEEGAAACRGWAHIELEQGRLTAIHLRTALAIRRSPLPRPGLRDPLDLAIPSICVDRPTLRSAILAAPRCSSSGGSLRASIG